MHLNLIGVSIYVFKLNYQAIENHIPNHNVNILFVNIYSEREEQKNKSLLTYIHVWKVSLQKKNWN